MGETAAEFLDLILPLLSRVCHRNPARSFLLADGTALLCARCAGLYAGAFAGAFASAVWWISGVRLESRAAALALGAAIAATPLETVGEAAGLWEGSRTLRLALGLLTGTALACAIIRSMGGGAIAPPGPCRRWLPAIPLVIDGALLPMILATHRWETTGMMIGATFLLLGLFVLLASPIAWLLVHLRRRSSSTPISEESTP